MRHYAMARGIEGAEIVRGVKDRKEFIKRIEMPACEGHKDTRMDAHGKACRDLMMERPDRSAPMYEPIPGNPAYPLPTSEPVCGQ